MHIFSETVRQEVDELSQRFGTPVVRTVTLGADALWDRRDRVQEVCMVVRRPNGRLLTVTKDFYPSGIYRLLTGGVEPGERALDALLREAYEETGLEVVVRRLLAVVAYRAERAVGVAESTPRAYTFAFLLDEVGGALAAVDPNERVADYGEIAPMDLAPSPTG